MRSRTYAYNGIILGILFGMAAGAYTESIPIGVIVAILGSVVCFLVIRFLDYRSHRCCSTGNKGLIYTDQVPHKPWSRHWTGSANI